MKGIIDEMEVDCIVELGAEVMEECEFGDNTFMGTNCMIGRRYAFKGHNIMASMIHLNT